MTVRLLVGDCRAMLATLPDNSVSMCCTSPPYYSLRAYGTSPQVWGGDPACPHSWREQRYYVEGGGTAGSSKEAFSEPGAANAARIKAARWREDAYCTRCAAWRGELGSEPTPELFCANLVSVFREVRRVLHPTGVLVLNLGDSYAGSGKGPTGHNGIGDQEARQGFTGPDNSGHHGEVWKGEGYKDAFRNSARYTGQKRQPMGGEGYKAKDLMQMPARVAMALQADGWYLRSVMPWLKRAAMPESVTDRPSNALEWLFLFSKAPRYFWDAEAIRQASQDVKGRTLSESADGGWRVTPNTGRLTNWKDKEYGAPPNGRAFRNTDPWFLSLDGAIAGARADLARLEAMRATGGVLADDDGLPLAVDINPAAYKEAHFATYPPTLVIPFVKAGTSERGCCPRCLAPWARVVERRLVPTPKACLANTYDVVKDAAGVASDDRGSKWSRDGHVKGLIRADDTLGWQPSCACDAGAPVKATVLDCFAGSGTTLLVADRLGRDAVGIELSEAYAQLARERLAGDAPLWMDMAEAGESVGHAPLGLFDEAAS